MTPEERARRLWLRYTGGDTSSPGGSFEVWAAEEFAAAHDEALSEVESLCRKRYSEFLEPEILGVIDDIVAMRNTHVARK